MALIRQKKSLGQNFLTDKNILKKIVNEFSIDGTEIILEIGAGVGALTEFLYEKNKDLIVVELDEEAVLILTEKFPDLKIIKGDFLEIDLNSFLKENEKIRIIGNIPYYITTPILFKLFENRDIIKDAIIMMQEEVANRLIAKPRTKEYGILTVLTQYFAIPHKLFNVSANVFYPKPKVNSTVIMLDFNRKRELDKEKEKIFVGLVRTAFNQRRKMLRNSIEKIIDDEMQKDIEFDFKRRAEELNLNEYLFLTEKIFEIRTKL